MDSICRCCGNNLGPKPAGCLPMIIGLIAGILLVIGGLYVMNGLTHGGIWK